MSRSLEQEDLDMAIALSLQAQEEQLPPQQQQFLGAHQSMLPISFSGAHHQPVPTTARAVPAVVDSDDTTKTTGSNWWSGGGGGGGGVAQWRGGGSRCRDYEVPDTHVDSRVVPPAATGGGQASDDWNLARTLQMLECSF